MPVGQISRKRVFRTPLRGKEMGAERPCEEGHGKFYNIDIQAFSSHYRKQNSVFEAF